METGKFWIAEFNISRLKAPLDSPIMKEVDRIHIQKELQVLR